MNSHHRAWVRTPYLPEKAARTMGTIRAPTVSEFTAAINAHFHARIGHEIAAAQQRVIRQTTMQQMMEHHELLHRVYGPSAESVCDCGWSAVDDTGHEAWCATQPAFLRPQAD
jgi:hypothetical protein